MVVTIFVFPGFDALDLALPTRCFGERRESFFLRYVSAHGGLIQSEQGMHVWTEPLNPAEVEDILVVPGGSGVERLLLLDSEIEGYLKKMSANTDYCIAFAEGIALLAQSGVLFHRTVADYPNLHGRQQIFDLSVQRSKYDPWVADGKFYTASSAMAGLPMLLHLIGECTDLSDAQEIAEQIGYEWEDA